MSKRVRLATGNEVEIVDRSSPHYGKKVIISDINRIPVTMIDPNLYLPTKKLSLSLNLMVSI